MFGRWLRMRFRELAISHGGTVKLTDLRTNSAPRTLLKVLILRSRSDRLRLQTPRVLLNLTVPARGAAPTLRFGSSRVTRRPPSRTVRLWPEASSRPCGPGSTPASSTNRIHNMLNHNNKSNGLRFGYHNRNQFFGPWRLCGAHVLSVRRRRRFCELITRRLASRGPVGKSRSPSAHARLNGTQCPSSLWRISLRCPPFAR